MNNKLLAIILLLSISNVIQAQERGLNFGFTYDNYIGKKAGSGHLKGFRFSFEQEKQQFGRSGSWRIGFKYSNGNYSNEYNAVKIEYFNLQNASLPVNIKLNGITAYKTWQFEFMNKMYLFNGNIQYGGLYMLLGLGINITRHETTYSFDENNYTITNKKEGNLDLNRQFTTNFGGGYDFNLEVVSLFIESDFNIPYLTIHDDDLFEFESRDSGHNFWSISLGLRLHLR